MKPKNHSVFFLISIIFCISIIFSCLYSEDEAFSEHIKIALREAGNQLLLSDQDSTSIILPVVALNNSKFELSFQDSLSIEPNTLVSHIDVTLKKSNLPENYLVEVLQCNGGEVAYSYKKTATSESTIIPCAGRSMPDDCYKIQIKFINIGVVSLFTKKTAFYIYVLSIVFLLGLYFYKKKHSPHTHNDNEAFAIGSFYFYPEQNKLIKAATEISLSNKECELLEIFAANPNQIVKRDELSKKVWEDNGVIVGRSLDTYISKLRKKLQEDDTIKLTNVHGVGYKLEL